MLKSLPRARRRAAIAFVAACLVAQTFLSSAERALAASDAGDCTPIAKIAKSLKDGVTVPGADLKFGDWRLVIG